MHKSQESSPTSQATTLSPSKKRMWIAAAISLPCLLAAGAWFAFPYAVQLLEDAQGQKLTSNLAGALPAFESEQSAEHQEPPDEYERPPYEGPSSAYIEEGADSKVLQFGFGQQGLDGEELQDDRKIPRLMSDGNVQAVIARNQNDLITCYGEELQYDENLAGKVDFEFAIAPDGHVAMVRVTRSTLRSKSAEDCFVEKARHWRFPRTNQELLTRFETDFTFAAR